MASYEKVTIKNQTFGDPSSGNYAQIPPEVLVCIECGSVVWPTRVSLHDAWHAKLIKADRDLSYGTKQVRHPRPKPYQ
jgi:hypothetical protein